MEIIRLWLDRLSAKLAPQENILGKLTLWLSLVMSFGGLPYQAYTNYLEKRSGLSAWLVTLLLGMFSARMPFTVIRRAYYLLPADMIGFIFTVVLAIQWFIYK